MIEVDAKSLLVTADTDHPMGQLEEKVAAEGYTLNFFAPPNNRALLADVLCRRIPNLYACAFGGIEDLCLQVKMAQTSGEVFSNIRTPRSAAGPGFKKMAIGAGDWLGIPIQATLRIFPKPSHRKTRAYIFSRERDLETFQRSLARLRWNLPLADRIPTEKAMHLMQGISLLDHVFAFSWWGEEAWMLAFGASLEALAAGKQGRLLDYREGRDEEDLAEVLHETALDALDRESERRQKDLSQSHRALMTFLKEGP